MPKIEPEYQTGAYWILNLENHRYYVGGAYEDFEKRRRDHLKALREGIHFNRHLQAAWNKYGEDNFEFLILERCPPEEVQACEQKWLDHLDAADREYGYNQTPTAGSLLGYKHSEEAKQKISQRNKGKKRTPEMCARFAEVKRGKSLTEEHKRKLSEAMKGREVSEATRAKLAAIQLGHKMSEESKAKMKESQARLLADPEVQQRMREAYKNRRPPSEEAKERIAAAVSAAHKGKPLSAEHRSKIAAAKRGGKWSAEAKAKLRLQNELLRITDPEYRRRKSLAGRIAAARRLGRFDEAARLVALANGTGPLLQDDVAIH